MSKAKQRLKFTNERVFEEKTDSNLDFEQENREESDNETDNGESVDITESENKNGNSNGVNDNQNAVAIEEKELSEEGELGESDSGMDLRAVLQVKKKKSTSKSKDVRKITRLSVNEGASTSVQDEAQARADNSNFENFMVWMDRYKKYQEWEASQGKTDKAATGPVGLKFRDKAIQSPSESTVYTRLCKSVESDLNLQPPGERWSPEKGERLLVESNECSSTATTVDDYADMDDNQIDDLILEARKAAEKDRRKRTATSTTGDASMNKRAKKETPAAASNYNEHENTSDDDDEELRKIAAEQESKARRDKILLDAELHRAQLLKPGKVNLNHVILDAQHKSLGSHVDSATKHRIVRNEFIELKDLLPRKKGVKNREFKPGMKLINDNGISKWVEEDDERFISSYKKWEEAFEIYASIYIKGYPHKASELYDYKHCIRDAANTYIWENVYDYDVEFRLHMAWCKGNRSWSAKLDYEWSRYMKNLLSFRHDRPNVDRNLAVPPGPSTAGNSRTREICNRYNKGRCTWGERCRYLHICKICKKRGHGALLCRNNKANRNKGDKTDKEKIETDVQGQSL